MADQRLVIIIQCMPLAASWPRIIERQLPCVGSILQPSTAIALHFNTADIISIPCLMISLIHCELCQANSMQSARAHSLFHSFFSSDNNFTVFSFLFPFFFYTGKEKRKGASKKSSDSKVITRWLSLRVYCTKKNKKKKKNKKGRVEGVFYFHHHALKCVQRGGTHTVEGLKVSIFTTW